MDQGEAEGLYGRVPWRYKSNFLRASTSVSAELVPALCLVALLLNFPRCYLKPVSSCTPTGKGPRRFVVLVSTCPKL